MGEQLRAREFTQKQNQLRDIESKVKRKMMELQHRESEIAADNVRMDAMREELKRRTEQMTQEQSEAAKRQTAEAKRTLQLEKDRICHLEGRIAELESDLSATRQRLREVETDCAACRRRSEEAPNARLEQENQTLQIGLKETKRQIEVITASRDHFRLKVEELCKRFMGGGGPHFASSAPGNGFEHSSVKKSSASAFGHERMSDTQEAIKGFEMAPVAEALHKIHEDVSKLAKDLIPSKKSKNVLHGRPSSAVVSARGACDDGTNDHLDWLQAEREELLHSGLYKSGDPVVKALNATIAEASYTGFGRRRCAV